MAYVTLREAAERLNTNISTVVCMAAQRDVHKIIGRTVSVDVKALYELQYQRLQEAPDIFPNKELAALVDHYITEEDMDQLDNLIVLLHGEAPQRIYEMADNDVFYGRICAYSPNFFRPQEHINADEAEEIHEAASELISQYQTSFDRQTSFIYNPRRQRESGLKRSAQAMVQKVSDYFDVDLPRHIQISPERRHYASIRYQRFANVA
ncbi:hypothetical protein HYX14_04180 [Candidatus Woesearchaeota archaeon]|nr:hypothetical protein [Candidatus Woesearchaeota archaeon]